MYVSSWIRIMKSLYACTAVIGLAALAGCATGPYYDYGSYGYDATYPGPYAYAPYSYYYGPSYYYSPPVVSGGIIIGGHSGRDHWHGHRDWTHAGNNWRGHHGQW